MKTVTDKNEVIDSLKVIPPLSIGVEGGRNDSTLLIGNYWPIYKRILEGKKVSRWEILWYILTYKFRKVEKFTNAHMFVYVGGGDNTVIETVPAKISYVLFSLPHGKVEKTDLKDKIHKDNWFRLYKNINMTVVGMQNAKSFLFGSIGKVYDLEAFLGFLDTDPNSEHNLSDAQICSESATDAVRESGVTFMDNTKSFKVHPQEAQEYLESEQGKSDGWIKVIEWGGEKVTIHD